MLHRGRIPEISADLKQRLGGLASLQLVRFCQQHVCRQTEVANASI